MAVRAVHLAVPALLPVPRGGEDRHRVGERDRVPQRDRVQSEPAEEVSGRGRTVSYPQGQSDRRLPEPVVVRVHHIR